MRAKKSAFDAWFTEQFGAPIRLLDGSDDALRNLVRMGERAADEIILRDRRFAQEQAALTAWNARGQNDPR